MRISNTWMAAFALAASSISPLLHAQDATLTPLEIQSAWVGKTVVALISGGKTIEMQLKPDGRAELSGSLSDAGTWRLSEQGYCATWKKIRAGQERCFTVIRKGAEIQVINLDGSLNSTVTAVR